MLPVQEHLQKNSLHSLNKDYDIKIVEKDDRVLLEYSMLGPINPITSSCRSIILERDTWNLISYSFKRFFNYGQKGAAKIDWESAVPLEKIDGSCIIIYTYKDKVYAQTRGTLDAEGNLPQGSLLPSGYEDSFRAGVLRVLKQKGLKLADFQNPGYCYVFEYTGPYNRVVIRYPEEDLTLLNVVDKSAPDRIIPFKEAIRYKPILSNFKTPRVFDLKGKGLLDFTNYTDQFEGYVVVDKDGNRIKIKNPAYTLSHKLFNAGGKLTLKRIIEFIEADKWDDLLVACPEYQEIIETVVERYNYLIATSNLIYHSYKDLPRKDLAKHLHENYKGKDSVLIGATFSRVDDNSSDFPNYFKDLSSRKKEEIFK